MPVALILLIVVAVGALATAAYVLVGEQSRRALVQRATGEPLGAGAFVAPGIIVDARTESVAERAARHIPRAWSPGAKTAEALVHAGFDNPSAPLLYAAGRLLFTALLVLLALAFAPRRHFVPFVLDVAAMGGIGWLLPAWYIRHAVTARQEKVRRSLPDCLDLLVVCIEAGISLDAALLRVAKDMTTPHPILARELLIINQKTNAGMPRQDALRGLWDRTGVAEVRALVSHIVQGEKWGTSTGKVLRVYAETLRRERRQAAEKRAATAPVKMLLPLGLFIFPALLLVVMGPVVMAVSKMFGTH